MVTPGTTVDRSPKRMRLGTRSCAECRRRKVRCIYGTNKTVCSECSLHEVDCIPQGAAKASRPNSEDGEDVYQKLANLEDMVRRICSTMDISTESLSQSQTAINTAEILRRIQDVSSRGEGSVGETDSTPASDIGSCSPDTTDPFADAPLLNLFKDAMLIQQVDTQGRMAARVPRDQRLSSCVRTFRALLPSVPGLVAILAVTKPYWPIWKDGQGLNIASTPDLLESVQSGKRFILDSLGSNNPALVAKAVLFLALCMQQLPNNLTKEQLSLSAHPGALLDSYLMVADMLLSISENPVPTIDGLECLEIIAKLYMNMGKPRESWLSYRRAINLALLLRLHDSDETAKEREHKVWSHLWQSDRQLSLILGLPAATSDVHPGLSRPYPGTSVGERVLYDMCVMAGHVNERNQKGANADYFTTLQIDQGLRSCLERIPSDWWNAQPSESTSIEMVYGLQVIKIQFYMLQKLLHQPYMLKSFENAEYQPNAIAACDASREMIQAYQTIRTHNGMELIICDLMDFQVFTAAVVLVIKLLSSTTPCVHSEESDWKLVHSVMDGLKKVAKGMECSVASQAAQTLEYLTAAYHGTYSGPGQYEAVIPYFGKVMIKRFMPRGAEPRNDPEDFQLDNPMQFPSTIDFAANSFAPFAWHDTPDFLSGAELGIDWTSLIEDGINYDWSQHFDCSRLGGAVVGDGGTFLPV
ncbi:uncharacterized protein PAC_10018 [Phialocephala subalpina]|uniref:Zn(2)-C6 fungal-type domain-containing protein n=1 Tax=Phialocephala subalpina TaxID=576137 RepID=A0A1L7X525_9HELO|nr:uncharacterized protein PAC_10018 [Phialocephala subalpina]